ncbi:MAG: 3-hydroxyacyl-CoA dehydrogenase [Candidatus Promineofilum sp.]|nr:3-hydroxyacyl-CoA dehydrogenase [Promineifilum sp.]
MTADEIRRVLVVGAGTMGGQIALQCALHGLDVTLYDVSTSALDTGMARVRGYVGHLAAQGRATAAVLDHIQPTTDLAAAAATADLVSESVPEDPALKGRVLAELNALCPPRTLFTTNTSTLLPSMFAAATGRPERFCALHFHLPVWDANVADVMAHPGTDPAVVETVTAFARRIGQFPIVLGREQSGYVFNTMLNALLGAALELAAKGVTPPAEVDRAWMGIMHTPVGPFGIMDAIGLDTVWKITDYWAGVSGDPKLRINADFVKGYIDQGRLGHKTGGGFYDYPEPAYRRPAFLPGEDT